MISPINSQRRLITRVLATAVVRNKEQTPVTKVEPGYTFTSVAVRHRIIEEAIEILKEIGMLVNNDEAISILHGSGTRVNGKRVYLTEALITKALKTAPSHVVIKDRYGNPKMNIGGNNVYFTPGSTAPWILDSESGITRTPTTKDLKAFAQLTDALPYYTAQSTGLVPGDVPLDIADSYRLYIALLHSPKPIVTGTFRKESFDVMHNMLAIARGNKEKLRENPLAIFDCCVSSPLSLGDDQAQTLINCAREGIPAEIISATQAGSTAPVTLIGAVTQHCAENIGALVIHQLASPGAPVIYGGCGMSLNMHSGMPLIGTAETMLLQGACTEIGKHLKLPTHGYMGLSDAKLTDYQAGMETTAGLIVAIQSGINNIAGPGMLECISCQSLAKLVLDHEACGMAMRLKYGIAIRENSPFFALPIIQEGIKQGEFLSLPHTVEQFRNEAPFPSAVIDHTTRNEWETMGSKNAWQRAQDHVQELLAHHTPPPLPENITVDLAECMEQAQSLVSA